MAQKKETPAKQGKMKDPSRRKFGKQLTGALAALPVAKILTTPGASAQASELKDEAAPVAATVKPQDREWNAAERFGAIKQALAQVMPFLVVDEASYAPVVEAAAASARAQREIDIAVRAAAKASGAREDQIVTWIDSFASLGKPGLMTDIPLSASDCAASLQGSWELTSRFSNGVEAATRSRIYGDMDPANGRGVQLITMSTDVNFFETSAAPILFLGLAEIQYTQNGPYEVIGTSTGTVYGNFPGYENGLKTTDSFRLVRRGQNQTMLGYPRRTEANGSDTAARTLVEVSGDPGTIKFKMWGSAATKDHPRTVDTVDTYALMSSRRPLIGGWEPITQYFERVARQGFAVNARNAMDRKTLKHFSEDIVIPRFAR